MKCIFLCLMASLPLYVSAQNKMLDSLQVVYNRAKTDTERVILLSRMGDVYAQSHPDSELLLAQRALLISRKTKFLKGEQLSLRQMAEAYQFMGNYSLALDYYLQRLQLDEQNPDSEREVYTLLSISNLYELEGDYKQALAYAQKAFSLIEANKLESYRWYSYIGFGNLYEKNNDLTQAKHYNEKAYELARIKKNDGWMGMSLNNAGNTFVKTKDFALASEYYHAALPYLQQDNNVSFLCESYQGLSAILVHFGKSDSAILYAKKAFQLAADRKLGNYYLQSCQLLTDLYKAKKMADSALAYEDRLVAMKDSLYSQAKVKQVESLTISEKLRQQERQQELVEAAKERSYKLNMLVVGLLIPFSFLVSVFLSKRKIRGRIVEFSGILSLLLFFEYLTLLLHPAIGNITNHSPFLEIIILVMIAAVLTPMHHRLEHWVLHQLARKPHATPVVAITATEIPGENKMEQIDAGEDKAITANE